VESLLATRKKLNPNNVESCFEMFGYDFIMDEDFSVWLIEVNTNPCLEESSGLLKHYLRRMIEDMIKIEVDPQYPNPRKKKAVNAAKEHKQKHKKTCKQRKHTRHYKRKGSNTKGDIQNDQIEEQELKDHEAVDDDLSNKSPRETAVPKLLKSNELQDDKLSNSMFISSHDLYNDICSDSSNESCITH
jgi:hypothetical protein